MSDNVTSCEPQGLGQTLKAEPEPEMPYYVGVKVIQAVPMTRHAFALHKDPLGYQLTGDDSPGYLVRYADGYESWSPAEAFEEAYFLMPNKAEADDMAAEAKDILRTA